MSFVICKGILMKRDMEKNTAGQTDQPGGLDGDRIKDQKDHGVDKEKDRKGFYVFYQVINGLIRILLAGILFCLFLHSIFSTSFIGKMTGEDGSVYERTLNIPDAPWKHFIVLFLVPAVMALVIILRDGLQKRTAKEQRFPVIFGSRMFDGERGERKFLGILCLIVAFAGCMWITSTQLVPGSDPAKVYTIAMQWREQNFSAFAEGGYLFRYPFQSGIVLFYYFWTFLFGINNYAGLQLVNVAALVLVYFFLARLAGYFWKEDRKIGPAVYIGLMLWVPLFFYITYLYGILVGMACALGAVYMAAKYLDTRKYRYMVIAALAMGLATVLKMNCLIYGIAIGCFLFYDIIVSPVKEKMKSGFFVLLLILGVAGCNGAANRYVEQITGYEPAGGEVMVSWVVMGLQDTPLGPGGYSGYIGDVFAKYHYDEKLITEASIADIKKILTRMAENPLDVGIPFFAAKTAFQWNDPTFIGMYLNDNRQSAVLMPDLAQSVIDGRGSVVLSMILNYMQSLIWFGALCCVLMRRRSRNLYELMGGVIFLGGYFFHFMWESSSSYTIPYFVVIIPYAVKGQLDLARRFKGFISRRFRSRQPAACMEVGAPAGVEAVGTIEDEIQQIPWGAKTPSEKRRAITAAAMFAALAGLVWAFTRTGLFERTIGLDDGPEAVQQFYSGRSAVEQLYSGSGKQESVDGYYLISPYSEPDCVLTQEGGLGSAVVTKHLGQVLADKGVPDAAEDGLTQEILVKVKNGTATLRFRNTGEVLAVSEAEGSIPVSYMDDSMNMFYSRDEGMKTTWKLRPAKDGTYYILSGEEALTWRDGAVVLAPLEETDAQKWRLE